MVIISLHVVSQNRNILVTILHLKKLTKRWFAETFRSKMSQQTFYCLLRHMRMCKWGLLICTFAEVGQPWQHSGVKTSGQTQHLYHCQILQPLTEKAAKKELHVRIYFSGTQWLFEVIYQIFICPFSIFKWPLSTVSER